MGPERPASTSAPHPARSGPAMVLLGALGVASVILLALVAGVPFGFGPGCGGVSYARAHGPGVTTVCPSSAVSSPTYAASTPGLYIDAPAPGTNFTGGQPATFSFHVTGFNLTPETGQPNAVGTGHVNLSIDGSFLEALSKSDPVTLSLGDGYHWASFELVNNDGSPLSPAVVRSVNFALTHAPDTDTPRIVIWTPQVGSTLEGSSVTVSFFVYDFAIVPPQGQPDAPNEGHVHAFLDGQYFAMITQEQAFLVSGLTNGEHSMRLLLVNNDHSSFHNVSAYTNFTVVNAAPYDPGTASLATLLASSALGVGAASLGGVILLLRRPPSGRRSAASAPRGPVAARTEAGGPGPSPETTSAPEFASWTRRALSVWEGANEAEVWPQVLATLTDPTRLLALTWGPSERLATRYGLTGARPLRLSRLDTEETSEEVVKPSDLDRLADHIEKHLAAGTGRAVVLPDVEALVSLSGAGNVRRLLEVCREVALEHKGSILFTLDPKAVSSSDRALLERNAKNLRP